MSSYFIRPLETKDIPAVTALLLNNLEDSLIKKLGKTFIKSYFLPRALQQSGLYNYVCVQDKIVGYLLFAKPEATIQKLAKKLLIPIVCHAALKCVIYPTLIFDLITSFKNKKLLDSEAYVTKLQKSTYLIYFAIDSQFQGKGLGSLALNHCLHELSVTNCVVETKSKKAVQFYQKNGFQKVGIRKRFLSKCDLLLRSTNPDFFNANSG